MNTNTKLKKSKSSPKQKNSNTRQSAKNVKKSNENYMTYVDIASEEAWAYANDLEGINLEKIN